MNTGSRKQKSGESSSNKDQDTTSMTQQKGGLEGKEEKTTVQYKTVDWEYCQQRPRESKKTRVRDGIWHRNSYRRIDTRQDMHWLGHEGKQKEEQ